MRTTYTIGSGWHVDSPRSSALLVSHPRFSESGVTLACQDPNGMLRSLASGIDHPLQGDLGTLRALANVGALTTTVRDGKRTLFVVEGKQDLINLATAEACDPPWELLITLENNAAGRPAWTIEAPLASSRIRLLQPKLLLRASTEPAPTDSAAVMLRGALVSSRMVAATDSETTRGSFSADWTFAERLIVGWTSVDTRRWAHGFGASWVPRGRHSDTGTRTAAGPEVPLPISECDTLSLESAHERRRSRRAFGDRQLDPDEVGYLLQHTLRVRERRSGGGIALRYRGIPSGGALSGIRLALLALREGEHFPAGGYEYDADLHCLNVLELEQHELRRWEVLQSRLTKSRGVPTFVGVVTLDYERPGAKYEAIVLATAYKEVGALLQSLNLLCEAKKLAFCAVGAGFSELRLADGRSRPVVGQFVVGSRPDDAGTR